MEESEYVEVALKCAGEADRAGADQAEAFLVSSRKLTVSVNGGRVENMVEANPLGLGLRVIKDSKQGFVYSSDFRGDSLKDLANKAVFLAEVGNPDDANGLPDEIGSSVSQEELGTYDPATADLDPKEAIAKALEMEKAAYSVDKRVKGTEACRYAAGEDLAVVADSLGRSLTYRGTSCVLVAAVVAHDPSGQMQSAGYYSSGRSKAKLETPEEIGREAARRAVSLVGATSVRTRRVPVVLSPDVAADWIASIFYALDGEEALKNTSFLSDKLNERIGSPLVTIIDDGIMPGGAASSPFDAEGVPTARNLIFDDGTCRSFVYNTYSARRAGGRSTGNAARGYDSPPGIGYHNLYLQAGDVSPKQIIASVKDGLYVMNTGAFGFDPNTGDYSYEAAGIWIENGELASPVHELTIASNTLDMLSAVEMVGNDLKFRGSVSSPTVKISEMSVSGRID